MPKHKKPRGSQSAGTSSGGALILRDVVDWLSKRNLDVPAALLAACPPAPASGAARTPSAAADKSAEFQWATSLLPALRERERRALSRYVQQRGAATSSAPSSGAGSCTAAAAAVVCSDDDADEADGTSTTPPSVRGGHWPADVAYSNDYAWGDDVPAELWRPYRPDGTRRRAAHPGPRTFSALITEAEHPAAGQCGLFAAVDLAAGAWVVDYVGAVSLGANEDKTSDYVCDFGEHSELALDANRLGNEGRFVNDYRNT